MEDEFTGQKFLLSFPGKDCKIKLSLVAPGSSSNEYPGL